MLGFIRSQCVHINIGRSHSFTSLYIKKNIDALRILLLQNVYTSHNEKD